MQTGVSMQVNAAQNKQEQIIGACNNLAELGKTDKPVSVNCVLCDPTHLTHGWY